MIEGRAQTWDDLKTLTPGDNLTVDDGSGLEARIEKCLNVKKCRPHILPGVGGGAIYSKGDMYPESEAYSVFRQIEEQHPGYTMLYNDNDHAWYAYVTLEENKWAKAVRTMCPVITTYIYPLDS